MRYNQIMKILITSGGTKIKIDLVRSITNMSKGTFGSRICDEFWKKIAYNGHERSAEWMNEKDITFFYHKDSKIPKAEALSNEMYNSGFSKIEYVTYDTFDDYRDGLKKLVIEQKYDIVVLAAAVSDYGVEKCYDGKYRSGDDMTIRLVKLPKVIDEVKKLLPAETVLCGFKLLVNSTDDQLREAMTQQIDRGVDVVIGNDLRDIKANNHKLTIKTRFNSDYIVYTKENGSLPAAVVDACMFAYAKKTSKIAEL